MELTQCTELKRQNSKKLGRENIYSAIITLLVPEMKLFKVGSSPRDAWCLGISLDDLGTRAGGNVIHK